MIAKWRLSSWWSAWHDGGSVESLLDLDPHAVYELLVLGDAFISLWSG
ncbi:hypothetical protein GGE66_000442 [Rhizobium leguminosarum]|uniref:Uncharacterized protein n=1 Tax=Rhizobium leguminosarum TaxID=384 RepID=A0A7W9ZMR1_RHILE|nr:hypothetical protein [Rhizobium leguminosarum]